MSSTPPPLIWFQLYDSATMEPYKKTTADYVSLPSTVVIAQFRDAVKTKYDQPSYLKDIPAGALHVYKNKAAFADGKEEPLDPTESLGLLGSKEDMLVVAVPSLTSFDQEIKALENSEEYKTLAYKNRTWAAPKPTEQEMNILSSNAHLVKKSDKTRKGYKKDAAIKDERLLLSDVAITLWERFQFDCAYEDGPSFGDLKRASGFSTCKHVRNYFRKKAKGEVKEDNIKESFTKEAWIWLIGLDQRVNPLLHDKLITNQDGSLRLVLEHDIYEDGARVAENIVQKLYGPEKKVDIKDASSDSSTSPSVVEPK